MGSLRAVAREMNTSNATISRQVTQLEEHFGLRLLHRSTRHLRLTDDGQSLRTYARDLLEMVEGMEATLGRRKSSPSGHVRVGIPVSLGLLLVQRLPMLIERYPDLSVELVMEDSVVNLITETLDLAIVSGEVATPSLIRRNIGTALRIAVAAPAYLECRGSPRRHDELLQHDCIVRRLVANESQWRLIGPDGRIDITVVGAVSANNHEAVRCAALAGLGIALLPEYQVIDDLQASKLQRVLEDYTSEEMPAYVVYPSRRHLASRIRVVIDFMIAEVGRFRSRRAESIAPPFRPGDEAGPPTRNVVTLAA
jgi:DNA-binding transcriptional LysR family regulator